MKEFAAIVFLLLIHRAYTNTNSGSPVQVQVISLSGCGKRQVKIIVCSVILYLLVPIKAILTTRSGSSRLTSKRRYNSLAQLNWMGQWLYQKTCLTIGISNWKSSLKCHLLVLLTLRSKMGTFLMPIFYPASQLRLDFVNSCILFSSTE